VREIAGRGQAVRAGRTHKAEDAHKGRPYYGRGLGAWVHFTRTITSGQPDGLGAGRGWKMPMRL